VNQPPFSPGIFVGFRRRGRSQLKPGWWGAVYATFGVRENLVLHAYNCNYLGMPWTAFSRRPGNAWRLRAANMLWIAELEGVTREEREEYVRAQLAVGKRELHIIHMDWRESAQDEL
jgi:hypothetical protein